MTGGVYFDIFILFEYGCGEAGGEGELADFVGIGGDGRDFLSFEGGGEAIGEGAGEGVDGEGRFAFLEAAVESCYFTEATWQVVGAVVAGVAASGAVLLVGALLCLVVGFFPAKMMVYNMEYNNK